MVSKKSDIKIVSDDEVDGSGGNIVEESYATILQKLGVDTAEMTIEDIENMVHQYTQEGRLKGAKVISLETGKSVQTFKQKKDATRTITVKEKSEKPVTPQEFERLKEEERYKKRSDKQDKPAPTTPFIPPTPKR